MKRPIAFTGHGIDRADHLRTDDARLAELRKGTDARLLKLAGLAPDLADGDCLCWSPCSECPDDTELVFLGLDRGAPLFAAVPPQGDDQPAYAQRNIWDVIARLPLNELALYGGARSLVDWHARHRFCAKCGQPTVLAKGGWQRNCPACEAQHFPRTDPVAIMLVENDGDLLLGRSTRFPPGSYSALAGFVEPGESIEEGVAREVLEEVGVTVRDVTYIASQPWPFPSQLMLGCHAFADDRTLTIDTTEIEDARWFTRDQVADALANGGGAFNPPPARAIAHFMLEWWLENR